MDSNGDLGGIAMSAQMLEARAAFSELESLTLYYRHMVGGPREKELALAIDAALRAMRTTDPSGFKREYFRFDELWRMEGAAHSVLQRPNGPSAPYGMHYASQPENPPTADSNEL